MLCTKNKSQLADRCRRSRLDEHGPAAPTERAGSSPRCGLHSAMASSPPSAGSVGWTALFSAERGPRHLGLGWLFFLFPFPSPFLFLPCLYLIYVSPWLVETRSQRGCGPEQRHPEGVRAQQGGLGEEWLPDRPTRQADPACLPDTRFPRIQLGDTYREIPIGGNRGRGRHHPQWCMRLITFMAKTPESIGSEIQKVLEPSWIIQVCSCAGGQGVPMVGFFTCWDLPQKCVLTIL